MTTEQRSAYEAATSGDTTSPAQIKEWEDESDAGREQYLADAIEAHYDPLTEGMRAEIAAWLLVDPNYSTFGARREAGLVWLASLRAEFGERVRPWGFDWKTAERWQLKHGEALRADAVGYIQDWENEHGAPMPSHDVGHVQNVMEDEAYERRQDPASFAGPDYFHDRAKCWHI